MRSRLAPLVGIYVATVALVAPGVLLAQEEPQHPAAVQEEPPQTTTAPAPAPAQAPEQQQQQQEQQPQQEQPQPPQPSAQSTPAPAAAGPAPAKKRKPKAPVARIAASASVTIRDFSFSPSSVTVNVGETVTWTNAGPTVHTATASDGSFDTGNLRKGQSGSHTFDEAGTYAYICTPHPNMKGTVKVVASSSGGGQTGSGSGDDSSGSGTAGTGSSGSSGDDGSDLPATGAQVGLVAALGAALFALGLAGRRRTVAD